ncbi:hypothetical protein SADUNF_Sadunf16G0265800 [Salix dunnii]|uniref:MLO-like protein n=1 Tax=Salix dunnii TaxID=1413687 RepID=A0A835JC89_9ROSI|nr:hypothetical protein SADUNF_Sadunf16G0265800 [Salix dunnii]
MEGDTKEMRSLALTPTWSVATVLTIFVVVSLIVERSIHRLSNWLRKTNRKPLLAAVEKMKEGIFQVLNATFDTAESPFCTFGHRSEIDEEAEDNSSQGRKLLMLPVLPHPLRRILNGLDQNTCKEGYEPFVSYQGLEQLHRFIFVMAITHISYSCLTMLLAIVKLILVFEEIKCYGLLLAGKEFVNFVPGLTLRCSSYFESILISVVAVAPCAGPMVAAINISLLVGSFNSILRSNMLTLQSASVVSTFVPLYLKYDSIHSWRVWEDVAHMDRHDVLTGGIEIFRKEQELASFSLLKKIDLDKINGVFGYENWRPNMKSERNLKEDVELEIDPNPCLRHLATGMSLLIDCYMIRSMEEEFQRIVGVSGPLWGFVVAFMLFNVKGSNLYFWIAIIPITLVLLVGAKLQHVIATLALETAGLTGHSVGAKLKPRDDLFWFKKPELMLSLIHFVLFQNAFELASFFWFWVTPFPLISIHWTWQFGYKSCFIRNHLLVYIRLILGFAGQFLCSYSTLPLYALVTQMGTNYKAALIPQRIRETIHGLAKAARRKRRHGNFTDDSTIHTDTSTVMSLEEDDHLLLDIPEIGDGPVTQIELQPASFIPVSPGPVANETSSRAGTPLLRPSASVSSSETPNFHVDGNKSDATCYEIDPLYVLCFLWNQTGFLFEVTMDPREEGFTLQGNKI